MLSFSVTFKVDPNEEKLKSEKCGLKFFFVCFFFYQTSCCNFGFTDVVLVLSVCLEAELRSLNNHTVKLSKL